MAFLLWHTVGSAKTHNDKEGSHVLPGRFRPMADDDYAASVPSEQAASDRLGPLELRHGAGPLVRPDGGESYAGQGDEAQRADGPPATAGMVLRHPAQTGSQAPSAACRDLLCAPPRVGGELVSGHPIGPGHRRHALGGTVCGAGRDRGVSGVRHARGTGIAFTRNQVPCTLLARWEEGYKDPWLILTDLAPEASDAGWYGLRAWIEQGFKITKRAGWQWHRTRMRDPDRAARLWLAVAVATLWLLSVGEVADETIPVSTLLDVTGMCPERPRTRRATRLRLVSVFRQGWVTLLVALLRHEPMPQGRFVPEPWPVVPPLEEEVPVPVRAMPKAA